jgi:hypothetical protein
MEMQRATQRIPITFLLYQWRDQALNLKVLSVLSMFYFSGRILLYQPLHGVLILVTMRLLTALPELQKNQT